jgi:Uma2 family endonuclease
MGMAHSARPRFTFTEYVWLDEMAGVKHEFLAGQAWAMAGGSPAHAGIAANISRLIGNALTGRPCRVFSSDLRVRVKETGLGTYPDVTVICGKLEIDPEDPKKQTALNPMVIVEVLSPSTEDYDRGEKLGHYKQVESLREVMLVAHDRHEVEVVRREDDGSWSRHIARDGDVVALARRSDASWQWPPSTKIRWLPYSPPTAAAMVARK